MRKGVIKQRKGNQMGNKVRRDQGRKKRIRQYTRWKRDHTETNRSKQGWIRKEMR